MGAVEGEDADLEAGDEHDDAPAGVGAADADVVEAAVVAQGEAAAGVDAVVADAVAGAVDDLSSGVGAFSGGERVEGWSSADGAVGSDLVVVGDEPVELALELFLGGRGGLGGEVLSRVKVPETGQSWA